MIWDLFVEAVEAIASGKTWRGVALRVVLTAVWMAVGMVLIWLAVSYFTS